INGVQINGSTSGGTVVQGNLIGTDITGTQGVGNGSNGVLILNAANNLIGGTSASARNVISSNVGGLGIVQSNATGNVIQGNYIGVDITGTQSLTNFSGDAIGIHSASNTIGGTAAGAGNVIASRSGNGISLQGDGNLVQGNLIGTDV